MKTKTCLHFALAAVVLAQLACAAVGGGLALDTPTPQDTAAPEESATPADTATPAETATPEATPLPTPVIPAPAAGKGNLAGLVLWNGQPVKQAAVKLCEEFETYSGSCKGSQYSTNTNAQGYYVFKNVTPRAYVVIINISSTSWWSYLVDGADPRKETVTAGQTVMLDPRNIYKVDLRATSPGQGKTISEAKPTLSWQAYPGAAYYEVTLSTEIFTDVLTNQRTDQTELSLDQPLLGCKYTWTVAAYNERDVKIAETRDTQAFTLTGQPATCHVALTSPKDGARLAASGLVLGWEPHPQAACYIVYILDKDYQDVLKQNVEAGQSSYTVTQSLAPGTYQWHVAACDSSGAWLADSEWRTLNIVSP